MMWGHNSQTRPWEEQETAVIQRMWAEGYSAAVIAKNLEGRSRNAVMGKLHRLGGYQRPYEKPLIRTMNGKAIKRRPPRKRAPKPPRTPYIEPEYIPVDPIKFLHRNMVTQCAFIPGDPLLGARAPEIQCCGALTVGGTSWCSRHLALVSLPAPKRDRRSDNGKSPSRFIWEVA